MNAEQMKRWALQIREHDGLPWLELSHGQALEVVVALTSNANSWNQFVGRQLVARMPDSIGGYFGAVARAQRRVHDLGVAPRATRSGRSFAAIQFLGTISGQPRHPLKLPWELLAAAGTRVPNVVGEARIDVEADPQVFVLPLSDWFFRQHIGLDRQYGQYPWDNTARLAVSRGFSASDADLIRELQREAPNHCWSLYSWLEVGVLDPDQEAFLQELQSDPDWKERFASLLRTDDGRIE